MRLKELIQVYRNKCDVIVDELSDYLHDILDEDEYCEMCKKVYSVVAGGHFNREFADKQIAKMYYTENGEKHFAPYCTETEAAQIYEEHKSKIPREYNFYDFDVVLNMVVSDFHDFVESNFGEEDTKEKYIDLAIAWLNDEDNPFGTEKAWGYFNSK